MYIPRGVAQRGALDAAIADIVGALGPDVVHVRYTLGQDWTGDDAIFFRVLLADRASKGNRLFPATRRVRDRILQTLDPVAQWGLLPYFEFRSQSEQAALKDVAWA